MQDASADIPFGCRSGASCLSNQLPHPAASHLNPGQASTLACMQAAHANPEFKATSMTKIQGGDDLQNAWRYLLKWERLNAGPDWVRRVSA